MSKKTYEFKSVNIWNYKDFNQEKDITVFVEVDNYKKYFMDISFLDD